MRIEIPVTLTPVKSVNFANYIGKCSSSEEFIYDFQYMQNCHPYGLLVTASAIRNNIKRFPNSKHRFENTQATQGGRFAASFGFYQSIGHDEGYLAKENDVGYKYIPIKKVSAKELHQQYTDTTLLNEKIERHAASLSRILVGDQSYEVQEAIQYCFREIIRNTFEHGKVDEFWVCGQYWPTRHEAEIAILDEGIGILNSLLPNPRITVRDCREANMLALQPGLSRTIGLRQDSSDIWQNSGYGLYVASTLCAMNSGYFIISSGSSAINVNGQGQYEYVSCQSGTAICLNIHTNSRKLRNFKQTLDAIVDEGQKKALENGEQRILTASKITTVASMIKHIENYIQASNLDTTTIESLIPLNTEVCFLATSINKQGEVTGTFEYNGQIFNGVLQNVTDFNRRQYVEHHMSVPAVVRKPKNGRYNLLEKHYYEKIKSR